MFQFPGKFLISSVCFLLIVLILHTTIVNNVHEDYSGYEDNYHNEDNSYYGGDDNESTTTPETVYAPAHETSIAIKDIPAYIKREYPEGSKYKYTTDANNPNVIKVMDKDSGKYIHKLERKSDGSSLQYWWDYKGKGQDVQIKTDPQGFKTETNHDPASGKIISSKRKKADGSVIETTFNGNSITEAYIKDGHKLYEYNSTDQKTTSPLVNELLNARSSSEKQMWIDKFVSIVDIDNAAYMFEAFKNANSGYNGGLLSYILADENGFSQDYKRNVLYKIKTAIISGAKADNRYIADIETELNEECAKFDNFDYIEALFIRAGKRVDVVDGSPDKNVAANGRIDAPIRQSRTGDCWLLAAIDAIANSPDGKRVLENSIHINSSTGSITVRLYDVNKEYIISSKDLQGSAHLSTGDMDVRAIEIAMERYFAETNIANKVKKYGLDNYSPITAIKILTGKDSLNIDANSEKFDSAIAGLNSNYAAVALITNTKGSAIAFNKQNGSVKLSGNHAYSIRYITNGNIYFVDPVNSGELLHLPAETFRKEFSSIIISEM